MVILNLIIKISYKIFYSPMLCCKNNILVMYTQVFSNIEIGDQIYSYLTATIDLSHSVELDWFADYRDSVMDSWKHKQP